MPEGSRLLVVEDDENLRNGLTEGLELEGYQVRAAADGEEATSMLEAELPELMLLDVMIPKKSGFDLCKELRRDGNPLPIIMLTAKGQEMDRVIGLELGADDYVTKPFSFRELIARIEAVLRRTGSQSTADSAPESIALDGITVDLANYEVIGSGETQPLTPKEVDLLRFLASRAGEVVERNTLLSEVWGYGYFGTTRTLDQTVARLRKKIETDPAKPAHLVTVHGVGYRLLL